MTRLMCHSAISNNAPGEFPRGYCILWETRSQLLHAKQGSLFNDIEKVSVT